MLTLVLFIENHILFEEGGSMEKVFSCKRCGFCCQGETTVSLSVEDQKNIAELVNLSLEEALQKYCVINGNEVQMKTIDGHCIFYDNGCKVHGGRPWRCRQWPLVPAILCDENNLVTIRSSCPGISKTASYTAMCNAVKRENSDD